MLFNSLSFLFFLPIVLIIYYRLGNWQKQNIWLLVASYFFYGWWDYRFLSLLLISSIVDFQCSKKIFRSTNSKIRKTFLLISLITNLSILAFFKYFNFFTESASDLLYFFGFTPSLFTLNILLPMGISFYTFQTMAYTIDVYRGKISPSKSFINFALYVSYFPQLVAGPIERAEHLLPQLETKRHITSQKISEGLILMLLGFFKKIAIADVAAPLVSQAFSQPSELNGFTLIIGVYLFAIQIYCDFSGYTDIARGTSKLLGIDLMENFQHPYLATSMTAFWRKWHISLSTWLRDYLYIPLGGNRKGKFKTYRNLMLTMLLGGLWHGASWNFVIWGALHGSYLSIERIIGKKGRNTKELGGIKRIFKSLLTFHLVCLAWIFFRAENFPLAIDYITSIVINTSISKPFEFEIWNFLRFCLPFMLFIFIEFKQYQESTHTFFLGKKLGYQFLITSALVLFTLIFGVFDEEVPFVYFQF